jgi:hypothetical protein
MAYITEVMASFCLYDNHRAYFNTYWAWHCIDVLTEQLDEEYTQEAYAIATA